MGFRQEVKDRLEKIEFGLGQIQKEIAALSQKPPDVERLQEQNKQLFDRLMSIDWERYVNNNPDRWVSPEKTQSSPPDEEEIIGQEVDDYAGSNKQSS